MALVSEAARKLTAGESVTLEELIKARTEVRILYKDCVGTLYKGMLHDEWEMLSDEIAERNHDG